MNQMTIKPWLYKTIPIIIWLLLLVLPFTSNPGNMPKEVHRSFLISIFVSNVLLLVIFYIHTYWVYPLIKTKGIGAYCLVLLALLVCYWVYWFFLSPQMPPPPNTFAGADNHQPHRGGGPGHFIHIISPLIAILCSFCYRVIMDNEVREQMIKERETVHLRTELNFLRSQISPHFMFNVLNNLVALARKKSDSLEPAIINLSQLMRYMLYESDDNRVPLSTEIEYLKNYIDLQLLRFGDTVKVKMAINGDTELLTIEPMLLIPFVENAFKHGTGMLEDPIILISLQVAETKPVIEFRVINSVSPMDLSKDENSGIGLANVQRRLAILYPGKHQLEVTENEDTFTTSLSIDFGG